jgi:hypothetical protein
MPSVQRHRRGREKIAAGIAKLLDHEIAAINGHRSPDPCEAAIRSRSGRVTDGVQRLRTSLVVTGLRGISHCRSRRDLMLPIWPKNTVPRYGGLLVFAAVRGIPVFPGSGLATGFWIASATDGMLATAFPLPVGISDAVLRGDDHGPHLPMLI